MYRLPCLCMSVSMSESTPPAWPSTPDSRSHCRSHPTTSTAPVRHTFYEYSAYRGGSGDRERSLASSANGSACRYARPPPTAQPHNHDIQTVAWASWAADEVTGFAPIRHGEPRGSLAPTASSLSSSSASAASTGAISCNTIDISGHIYATCLFTTVRHTNMRHSLRTYKISRTQNSAHTAVCVRCGGRRGFNHADGQG